MSNLRAGSRLRSVTCTTEVMVVRAGTQEVDLCCGGHSMVDMTAQVERLDVLPAFSDGTKLGKRYTYPDLELEVLCTKPGAGSLSVGDTPLTVAAPKVLPSSD